MREGFLLVVAIVILCRPPLSAGSATPFQLGDQGGVIVPVKVDGAGPFPMLLDTGATHSAITEEVAVTVRARVVAQSKVIMTAGDTLRAIVAVDRISVGSVVVEHVLPSIVPRGAFDRDSVIQGLIGQDVLSGLRFTLDFKDRHVEWHDDAPSPRGTTLTLEFEHGRFLVALPQNGCTLRLVPDSGAGALVLFDAGGHASLHAVESRTKVELWSAQSTQVVHEIRIPRLRVGDKTLRDVRAVTVDRPGRHPAEGDGLLPLHLFERVTFDSPGRVLILG